MTVPAVDSPAHAHGAGVGLEPILLLLAAAAVLAYVGAVEVSRRRGRSWPLHRVVLWTGGVACAAVAAVDPLADAARTSFTAHMGAHLLAGMLAPILLVLAAPVTLALRTLSTIPARRLSRLLRSAPARVLAHPITATVLSAGGLWLIHRTPVLEAMHGAPLLHALLIAHFLLAGCLVTAAIIGIDPRPHPPARVTQAVALVVAMASHAILAKQLYATPPAVFAPADVRAGAELMYTAGAWLEAVVVIVFCAQWYRAAGRRLVVGEGRVERCAEGRAGRQIARRPA
ncbi:cytochrome c oxidase assembly protein [Rathayibacter sp. VKM Ac-2856]|uniref:cytochrome c oxidase assembly protein n=1 Tax=unclassified Rathayibacter TaxID=2609250 RepID=UPI00156460C3|nr:cytochrome c oxidase assembly protein [Rathayibacter sp. VKM Ac-2858]NQX18827.1 cytochrome c oxidase assembly protein [Rathayibacter sp. VKM Ac-2856]